jgi:diacylglycerol O-acyltransferase
MDRLSPLDAEFLHLEDGVSHLHIAGVSVFEGPPPAEEELAELVRAKIHLIPRYRQRVRSVPLELGRPVWVDAPDFDLAHHLRRLVLPAPGDDAALSRTMAELMSEPLDRDRPLWETVLVEGLPEGRWALIFKIHHCMVDGVSGVALLNVLLDIERDVGLPDPEPWQPESEPSPVARVVDAWSGLVGDAGALARRLPGVLADPVGSVRSLTETGQGLLRFGRHLSTTEPLSIEGSIGPDRTWAHSSVSLADVKTVRQAFGGTVNDVVLGAVSGGYRELLASRNEDPDVAVVRTLVPVSVRTESGEGMFDNQVSGLLFELPVHLADPVERLALVCEQMADLKDSHMAEAGEAVMVLSALAPPMLLETGSRLAVRLMHQLPQRSVNTVTTNVPGPQLPLYCLGREMLEYRPYVPITHGVRVATAILSYNGRLAFGVTGDRDTAPDVGLLADAIAGGVDDLRRRAGTSSAG